MRTPLDHFRDAGTPRPPSCPLRFARLAAGLALLALPLLAGGCGSSGTDAGGFTSSLRQSAQSALNGLQYSAIPQELSQVNLTTQVLNTCTVHVVSTKPLVFRLFMDWNPKYSGKRLSTSQSVNEQLVRFTWFWATIPENGATPTFQLGQIPANIPIQKATHDLEAHYGPAFVSPFENCELLPNGTIYGYSYGTLTAPISTVTTPTGTTQTTIP